MCHVRALYLIAITSAHCTCCWLLESNSISALAASDIIDGAIGGNTYTPLICCARVLRQLAVAVALCNCCCLAPLHPMVHWPSWPLLSLVAPGDNGGGTYTPVMCCDLCAVAAWSWQVLSCLGLSCLGCPAGRRTLPRVQSPDLRSLHQWLLLSPESAREIEPKRYDIVVATSNQSPISLDGV